MPPVVKSVILPDVAKDVGQGTVSGSKGQKNIHRKAHINDDL